MAIRTIIFDLGNVILNYSNEKLYRNLADFSPLKWNKVRNKINNLYKQFGRGEIKPKEFWRKVSELIKIELSYGKFKEMWCSHFSRNKLMEKMIKNLKENHELLLLSNTNKLHYKFAEENIPILKHLDAHVLSFDIGVRKPDPKIFKTVLKMTDSKSEECVYTDDKREYVRVARKLGIRGIWFKDPKYFERKLALMKSPDLL